ncbi:MAG: EamA family transporter [Candidatus Paceibacterota bacterium]
MWIFYAFLSALFAALVAIFAKLGLKELDTTLATTIRAIVMVFLLISVSLALGKFDGFHFSSLAGREWLLIILAGIAGALSWLFYFFALKHGLASGVVAIDRLSIVFVVILAALFLGESFGLKVALGAVLMAGGAVLISLR